jgi:hypothetical protein
MAVAGTEFGLMSRHSPRALGGPTSWRQPVIRRRGVPSTSSARINANVARDTSRGLCLDCRDWAVVAAISRRGLARPYLADDQARVRHEALWPVLRPGALCRLRRLEALCRLARQ